MPTCANCSAELPAGARFCAACGAPVEERVAAEERKLATVLFADLVGSTGLGEQDPERTRALLDRFYDAMAAEIESAGGTVEKFIGDAVMAAFGAPVALEDHAERALHAALAMQRRLQDLFGAELALRIGINTGDVVVGRAREGSSFVTGDAVNVAQRLEAGADPGTILVGERTVAAVRGAFEFAPVEQIEAKGKRETVAGRRLLRALTLMRPRGVGELGRTFVGRDEELGQLQKAYERALERGEPELVTVVGDPGVGKTRLARELWQWLETSSPEPLRRTGRCLSYGQGITYWPLGEVLREHFGLLENDRPEVVLNKLAGREILALTLGLDVAGDLHPLAVRDRLHDTWLELLEELARERPLVMLIEDVHWAEDDLFDLLERIVRDATGPMLLLATARPELVDRRPGFAAGTTVRLEPLSAADSARMLRDLLETELPEPVREMIVERAEGNPFFVEELISTLVDRGLLQREQGRWVLQEVPDGFEIPDSVQAVLAARIDLLPTAEKAALQAASVIGRVFWTGPVYELAEGLEPDFRILEERDFIRRRSGSTMAGQREYVIKHALTREIAYAGLPKARRARLHAAFAGWIERVGRGRDEDAALLGHHYAQAVRPEDVDLAWAGDETEVPKLRQQAVAWLRRAAELAVGRYELEDGVELLQQALELETDAIGHAQLWREIGRAHVLRFDGEPFWAAMQQSLSVCPDRQTCADTYAELAHQTAIRAGMWRTRPAIELVDGWIDRALELAEPDSRARAKALIARCYWHRDGVREAADAATELAEKLGEVELRAQAYGAYVVAAFAAGEFNEALTWSRRQLELAEEISNPDVRADAYEVAIPAYCAVGRFEEARHFALLNDALLQPLTAHHRLHGISIQLEVEETVEDWGAVLALAERTEAAVEANLDTPCIRNARCLLVTALAAAGSGDDARARKLEARADEVATAGYAIALAAPRIRLALLRRKIDDVDALAPPFAESETRTWFALQTAAARLDALAELDDRRVEQEAPALARPKTYLEPFALRALGRVRGDESLIENAAELFDALNLTSHAAVTRGLLSAA